MVLQVSERRNYILKKLHEGLERLYQHFSDKCCIYNVMYLYKLMSAHFRWQFGRRPEVPD